MSRVLDASSDQNYVDLHLFSRLYQFPDYVKQASPEDTMRPKDLPAAAYADPRLRHFPCHTKAACWLSAAYFLEKKPEMNRKTAEWIERGLQQFAQHLGIQADVAALQQRHAEIHKQADSELPDSAYAIVWAKEGGGKERRYRLTNALEVKAAAEWFAQHRDHFIYADRQQIAEKILEKAAAFGAGLPEEIDVLLEKQAGNGVYDPKEACDMLRNRGRLSNLEGVRDRFFKLAETLEHNPVLAQDLVTSRKIAEMVDQFDRGFNLVGKYSDAIPRPEDVLFRGCLKAASQFVKRACATLSGSIYDRNQFSKLSVASVRESLGTDIAKAVTSGICVDPEKMAEVASTLPLPDAVLLDSLMSSVGELPQHSKASSVGLQAENRASLAAEYRYADSLPGVHNAGSPTIKAGSRIIGAAV